MASGSANPNPINIMIRRATPADTATLAHICLVTADAGASAAHLHTHGDLPGLVYALPYVQPALAECTFAYVMEVHHSNAEPGADSHSVVGYVLGASDTRTFEERAERAWWPGARARFPLGISGQVPGPALMPADEHCIALLHAPSRAEEACVAFSPAHLHIDILPEYQRRGWGRRLIGRAVGHLRDAGLQGVWLGMDPRNKGAAVFYKRLGFEGIEGAGDHCVGLRFEKWTGPSVTIT